MRILHLKIAPVFRSSRWGWHFVHITDERNIPGILRNGIALGKHKVIFFVILRPPQDDVHFAFPVPDVPAAVATRTAALLE